MKKDASDLSIDELEQLLEKKRKELKKAPAPLMVPNFDNIVQTAKDYVADIENDREPRDIEHWCFEAVLEAVYGPKVWHWLNGLHR
jgi:hypothetical protein